MALSSTYLAADGNSGIAVGYQVTACVYLGTGVLVRLYLCVCLAQAA